MNVAKNTFYGTRIAETDKNYPYRTMEDRLKVFELRKVAIEQHILDEIEEEKQMDRERRDIRRMQQLEKMKKQKEFHKEWTAQTKVNWQETQYVKERRIARFQRLQETFDDKLTRILIKK